jgi:hypothetical protein
VGDVLRGYGSLGYLLCHVPAGVFGTAGCGVWLVHNAGELEPLARTLEAAGSFRDGGVLVQQPAPGILCVVQTVFQRGRLVAGHTYQARALGVGGSARARVSIHHPEVLDHIRTLGASLRWLDPESAAAYAACIAAAADMALMMNIHPLCSAIWRSTPEGSDRQAEADAHIALMRQYVGNPFRP